jgi:hypothetical protein
VGILPAAFFSRAQRFFSRIRVADLAALSSRYFSQADFSLLFAPALVTIRA